MTDDLMDGPAHAECAGPSLSRLCGVDRAWVVSESCLSDVMGSLDMVPVLVVDREACRVRVADLPTMAQELHGQGSRLVVDVTSAGTFGCRACEHGADVEVCRTDGGVVVGLARDALRQGGLSALVGELDSHAIPCGQVVQDITDSRVRRQEAMDAAAVAARYLSCHPLVRQVSYPGLPHDPSHAVATSVLSHGFGPSVLFRLAGEGTSAPAHLLDCSGETASHVVPTLEGRIAAHRA